MAAGEAGLAAQPADLQTLTATTRPMRATTPVPTRELKSTGPVAQPDGALLGGTAVLTHYSVLQWPGPPTEVLRVSVPRETTDAGGQRRGSNRVMEAAYRQAGDYGQALRLMAQWLAADPGNPQALWERARVYVAQGEYEKAQRDLETAESTWGGDLAPGTLWFDRAAVEYHLGHYDKVTEYVETGLRYTWVDWGVPFYCLGMVCLKEGKVDEGVQALRWAEATLNENDPLLEATQRELQRLGY